MSLCIVVILVALIFMSDGEGMTPSVRVSTERMPSNTTSHIRGFGSPAQLFVWEVPLLRGDAAGFDDTSTQQCDPLVGYRQAWSDVAPSSSGGHDVRTVLV